MAIRSSLPGPARSRVQEVTEYVKGLIVSGVVGSGDQLPTEVEIATELGVSRTPVREAIKALDAGGLVEIRRGAGTFVRDNVGPSLAQLLLFQRYLDEASPQTVMEMRQVFERNCAELAAQRRTQDDLDAMRKTIDGQRALAASTSSSATIDEFLKLDLAFHRAIYRASGNELIATMANFVLDMVAPLMRRSIQVNGQVHVVKLHEAMLAVIELQKPAAVGGMYDPVSLNMESWRDALEQQQPQKSDAL